MHRAHVPLAFAAILAACSRESPPQAAADSAAAFSSARLSIVTQGSGPDIILVPGLTSDRTVWDSIAARVSGRYRLHLVQVNGFSGSPPGPNAEGPVSAPVAEELARYIQETGLNRPAVVGHSMGGSIGLMLAARHPDRVGHLMVVDMYPNLAEVFAPGAPPEAVRRIADSMRAGMLAATADSFAASFGQMIANMTRLEDRKPGLLRMVQSSDRTTVANAFHELLVTDLRPELGRITAPVVVLYATPTNVPLSGEQFAAIMRQAYSGIPNVRLVLVPESLHFIQLDQPERVVAELDSLIRGAGTAP